MAIHAELRDSMLFCATVWLCATMECCAAWWGAILC